MRRKIILNLAMSLDGFIVDKYGGFDWIKGDNDKTLDTDQFFRFDDFLDSVDVVVMGRKSYEDIGVGDYSLKRVIVATSKKMKNHDNVEFVDNEIVDYIKEIKKSDGKNIWLFGGSGLTDNFMKADAVDEFIIGIIPVLLGEGKPLFYGGSPTVKLHLDSLTVKEGIVILKYSRR